MTKRTVSPLVRLDECVAEVGRYVERSGEATSMIGMKACGNPRAVERIRERSASIATLAAVLAYIEREST